MDDESVQLGWRILRAIPQDDSPRSYGARLAVHSLVWRVWKLEDEMAKISEAERRRLRNQIIWRYYILAPIAIVAGIWILDKL